MELLLLKPLYIMLHIIELPQPVIITTTVFIAIVIIITTLVKYNIVSINNYFNFTSYSDENIDILISACKDVLEELIHNSNYNKMTPICTTTLGIEGGQLFYAFFVSHKPSETLHTKFFNHPSYTGTLLWWDKKEINQRIEFLKYLLLHLRIEQLRRRYYGRKG